MRFDPWSAIFAADVFIDLLMSQSDHRVIADGERAPIVDGARGLITDNGGRISVPKRPSFSSLVWLEAEAFGVTCWTAQEAEHGIRAQKGAG